MRTIVGRRARGVVRVCGWRRRLFPGVGYADHRRGIFGSPAGGTPVMDAAPLAALDLPLKLLVWDDTGQTRVSYLAPAALAARYALSESLAAPLAGIDQLTDTALTDGASNPR